MPRDFGPWDVDPDGYPLDPAHPWNQPPPAATRLDPTARRLRGLERAFKDEGVVLAAVEGMLVCRESDVPFPTWLQKAGIEIITLMLAGQLRTPGRTGNAIARYREDLKHFTRWSLVDEIRGHRTSSEEEDRFGRSLSDCYAIAAQELRGTFAQGSPGAVEASFKLVQLAYTKGRSRFPYLYRCVRQLKLDRR
jgi:hypothetical protein